MEPVDTLVINPPAFAPEQDIDAPETEPNPSVRNLSHTGSKRFIEGLTFGSLIPTRPALKAHSARALNADPTPIDEMAYELLSLRRPWSFFRRTSCSMTLSRLRSATSCLSLRFSYSSWRSRRSSETPIPPNFFFQA
jgi:hypothetical protein